ncbi:DUF2334 domain-containing protein [Holdemanella biformis]|uniref:DUF2334 domain-containing protein n=1 Tax=Holdemanella biformis TaxID=1735 RepID=UPI003567385C
MSKYLLRLDDASDYMDVEKWQRMENLLDKYGIKPLVGIIPDNKDASLIYNYKQDLTFWTKVLSWKNKGWELALHGCYHKYTTKEGGINPVNKRSEFAGVSLDEQRKMIRHGIDILKQYGIVTNVFFAPSHTFDKNTLIALKEESNIRIISDTIANDVYFENDFYFIPEQSGRVRNLPFKLCTFCYHPNTMSDKDFENLEIFLKKYYFKFVAVKEIELKKRSKSLFDKLLHFMYFVKR